MEIVPHAAYISNQDWSIIQSRNSTTKQRSLEGTVWTNEENKAFENALARYDKETPDRWHKVAAMVPGKTVADVIKQYRELEDDVSSIEAGLLPLHLFKHTAPFTLVCGNGHPCDGFKQPFGVTGKRSSTNRPSDQERKKGVPWTEEEHRLFLLGLEKYGKGDWRNISRNYVMSRTPTQVASHAQKYFIRQHSGGKDKRRASIHDITTVNLNDDQIPSPGSKRLHSPDNPGVVSLSRQTNPSAMHKMPFQWNHHQANGGSVMSFGMGSHGNIFMPPNGINPYDLRMHSKNFERGAMNHDWCQNMAFEMQQPAAAHQYPHA